MGPDSFDDSQFPPPDIRWGLMSLAISLAPGFVTYPPNRPPETWGVGHWQISKLKR